MKKLLLTTFLLSILVNVNSQTLIAHYPLDGNGIDVSGNSLNGTETNLTAADDKDGNAVMATEFWLILLSMFTILQHLTLALKEA